MLLREKLTAFFTCLLIIVLVIALYSSKITFKYLNRYEYILSIQYDINGFLSELKNNVTLMEDFLVGEEVPASKIYASQDKLNSMLKKIHVGSQINQDAYFEIRSLSNALDVYMSECKTVIKNYWLEETYYPLYYHCKTISTYMESYIHRLQNILLSESHSFYHKMSSDSTRIQQFYSILMIVACIVIFQFAYGFAGRITNPIHQLSSAAKKIAEGDLDTSLALDYQDYGDEIDELSHSFNKMAINIRELVRSLEEASKLEKDLHEKELEKESALSALREAQLTSLQTQIKPHFLFNTLNTIRRQAELEDAEQTVELIRSLAQLFRFNLVSHQQKIILEQELLAVKEYMFLQQKRFGEERIRYLFKCKIDCSKILIPPLVIQTFVENAMKHGLEPKIEGGFLLLDIKQKENNCIIRIFDSGCGIKKDIVEKINEYNTVTINPQEGAVHGIGLKNIFTRMKLLYGDKFFIKLYSKLNQGTFVKIVFPYEEKA